MECEVIAMTSRLFSEQDVYGLVTPGGTDSILYAMYSYREWGRKKGIKNPNMYPLFKLFLFLLEN